MRRARLRGKILVGMGAALSAALLVAPAGAAEGTSRAPSAAPPGGAAPDAAPAAGLPAKVTSYTPDSVNEAGPFQTVDYSSSAAGVVGTTNWRVVNGTGNGAEHWITATSDGQLLDLGGRYLNISADNGRTWTSVQPQIPLVNAEGAVATAPNGDIVGATWDPYSGDHLLTFKYDAASKAWSYLEDPLHTPFYDRPEVNVIPGPITVNGTTLPYISTVSSHGSPIFYSTDGLTYDNAIQTGAAVSEWVPTVPNPALDWAQSQDWAPFHALGGGFALDLLAYGGGAEDFSPADRTSTVNIFDPRDLSLHPFSLPNGKTLPVNLQVDSRGWLHAVTVAASSFTYQLSTDGGQTWNVLTVPFPDNDRINSNTGGRVLDLRVNGALGVAAVLTRTDDGPGRPGVAGDPEQDWVYKVDVSSSTPQVLRRYAVGLGNATSDTEYHPTYETEGHRYDFASVAILPTGGVVATMLDESTVSAFPSIGTKIVAPALAFEEDTTLPGPPALPEAPLAVLVLASGVAVLGAAVLRRRRRQSQGC